MSESMIERVAIALYEDRVGEDAAWPSEPELTRENFRGHARAAIEAMRNPDGAMMSAAVAWTDVKYDTAHKASKERDRGLKNQVKSLWRAMISAALEPQDAGKVAQRAGA